MTIFCIYVLILNVLKIILLINLWAAASCHLPQTMRTSKRQIKNSSIPFLKDRKFIDSRKHNRLENFQKSSHWFMLENNKELISYSVLKKSFTSCSRMKWLNIPIALLELSRLEINLVIWLKVVVHWFLPILR